MNYSSIISRVLNISDGTIVFSLEALWSRLPNNVDIIGAFNYVVDGGRRSGFFTKYSNSYGWIMVGHYSQGVHLYSVNNNVFNLIV